jgi:hypothetical protein
MPDPARPLDPRDSESRFGVLEFLHWDHDWNARHYAGDKPERVAALMKEAGVGFVRMDFLWDDVEPEKDRFEFGKYDRLVDTLDRNGVKILGLLNYNTAWGGDRWNAAPDPALFTRYACEVVKRYKGKVKYWEIWNEPDQDIYWAPQDGMKAYTALLKRVFPAIKETDPTAVVLLGGLSGAVVPSLKEVYANGGGPYFDAANIHPFTDPQTPDGLDRMRGICRDVKKVMEANGDAAKPIWVTEVGCPGVDDPDATQPWWLGKNPDEAAQAKWVEKIYAESKRWPGVEKVFWAFFRDTPNHFLTGTDYFGVLRRDFSKKPAFEAYKKASSAEN